MDQNFWFKFIIGISSKLLYRLVHGGSHQSDQTHFTGPFGSRGANLAHRIQCMWRVILGFGRRIHLHGMQRAGYLIIYVRLVKATENHKHTPSWIKYPSTSLYLRCAKQRPVFLLCVCSNLVSSHGATNQEPKVCKVQRVNSQHHHGPIQYIWELWESVKNRRIDQHDAT